MKLNSRSYIIKPRYIAHKVNQSTNWISCYSSECCVLPVNSTTQKFLLTETCLFRWCIFFLARPNLRSLQKVCISFGLNFFGRIEPPQNKRRPYWKWHSNWLVLRIINVIWPLTTIERVYGCTRFDVTAGSMVISELSHRLRFAPAMKCSLNGQILCSAALHFLSSHLQRVNECGSESSVI